MEKLIKFIPLSLFFAYSCKLMHSGASFSDAIPLTVLAACSAFYEFKDNDKKIITLKSELAALKLEQEAHVKSMLELRSHVSSLKLGNVYTNLTAKK